MHNPFFTVVIPTHNRSNLLKRAVVSVLNQTFEECNLWLRVAKSAGDAQRQPQVTPGRVVQSIDAGEQMVGQIYSSLASTFGPRVIESRNTFAGMFRLDYDEKLFKKNNAN